jgi:hypothetical protein
MNIITLSTDIYNEFVLNSIKLHLIEKAIAEDKCRHDNFFESSTVEKIKFVLDEREQSESVEVNENE